ncbi:MAG TPA: S8 family serine peptidase [Candidatus Polarisedimenticolaceae bacterium]|nr:S8 family serine peptidase [Candidatus Polarisedimenticolaceae bacterium]
MPLLTAVVLSALIAPSIPAAPAARCDAAAVGLAVGCVPVRDVTPRSDSSGAPRYHIARFRSVGELADFRRDHREIVLDYLPVNALVVRLTAELAAEIAAHPGLDGLEPYRSSYKLHPALTRPGARGGLAPNGRLAVALFEDDSVDAVVRSVRSRGIEVEQIVVSPYRVTLYLVAAEPVWDAELSRLTREEAVRFIEPAPWPRTMNSNTDEVLQGGFVGAGRPYRDAGITGAGQEASVMDSGLDVDTIWFADLPTDAGVPGPGHRKVASYVAWGQGTIGTCSCVDISPIPAQPFSLSHGTAVTAGILANRTDFGLTDVVEGMAPGARVHFQDIGDSLGGAGTCGGGALYPPSDLTLPLVDASNRGARVHNLSWGTIQGDTYSASAIDVDAFLWTHPESVVVLPGGDCGPEGGAQCPSPGFASIGTPATAKNDITVGGADQDPIQDDVDSSSSRGPETVTSGRTGPTVTMIDTDTVRAHAIASVNAPQDLGANCTFATGDCDIEGAPGAACVAFGLSGTSYATGFTSGAALLVRDYLARGFYPSGAANAGNELTGPSGAAIKALIVNSAEFMTGAGAGTDRFNNDQGYGRVLLSNTLPLANDAATPAGLALWDFGRAVGLDGSEPERYHLFEVIDTSREVRVTLAYYDAPSPAGSAGALINDLSLEITSPDGKSYRGNHFSGASTPADAGVEDSLNPTEMVVIDPNALVPGRYVATVRVGAAGVPEPHPSFGGQPYALVATGGLVQRDLPHLGEVDDGAGSAAAPLVAGFDGTQVVLDWSASCLPGDYIVYKGTLASLSGSSTSQATVLAASTGGLPGATDAALEGNHYYVVAPHDGAFEGSYGRDSDLAERPQSVNSPFLRSLEPCSPP